MKSIPGLVVAAFLVSLWLPGRCLASEDQLKLKSIQIMFRHGERQPKQSYEGSGNAGLTEEGKKEIYALGRYFRSKYDGFLSSKFDPSEVSIVSSDLDRTLQSASLFAAGLYEGFNTESGWSGGKVRYEPIPVRSIPTLMDRYFQMTEPCPRYTEQLFMEIVDDGVEYFVKEQEGPVREYVNATGDQRLLDPAVTGLKKADILDIFSEQLRHNISRNIPLSPLGEQLGKYADLFNLNAYLLPFLNKPDEAVRLYSGPLLSFILENFKTGQKATIMSSHDRSVFGQLAILGIADPMTPPPGSALIYELYEEATGTGQPERYILEAQYRNSTSGEPRKLDIPGCSQPCYLDEFAKAKGHLIPVDYEQECRAI